MRALLPIAAAIVLSFTVDALLFRTGRYATILEPDSAGGTFEGLIHVEGSRKLTGNHNALVLGDSRVAEGFSSKLANQLSAETGWHFWNVGTPGTTPRCWYYLVRGLDPAAERYQAILIPLDNYGDVDGYEDYSTRLVDLHFVINRLRLRDIPDFAASYASAPLRVDAALGALWEGLTYQQDFQGFLEDPPKRIERAAQFRAHAVDYWESYDGMDKSMSGLEADWPVKTVRGAPVTPEYRRMIEEDLFVTPPQHGRTTPYRRLWLGRIMRHYAARGTRIVFFRVPQTPVARRDPPPSKADTFLRGVSGDPAVVVLDEHVFDSFQRPELFADPKHLNRAGRHLFSPSLAREAARRLN